MKKTKNAFEKITQKVASAMIDKETREWPPTCSFFAYQPVHPTVSMNKKTEADKEQD